MRIEKIKMQIAFYVGEPKKSIKRNTKFERCKLRLGDFSVFDKGRNKMRYFRITNYKSWAEVDDIVIHI